MSVDSIKHGHEQRPHIPSQEEAGYEQASMVVRDGAAKTDYPKNPVVHRGQDPELFWLEKYGEDDADDRLTVDIRSLYRTEHVAPEKLIENLYRITAANPRQPDLFSVNALFGNALERDELEKVSDYYTHQDGWTNRLIQGDSLLVMTSLLEREGLAGKVQMVYIDPPYGIKYGSNWQMKLNSRTVQDGKDDHLSGEPEVIKAYRDTWELGIHSYLSYLRDRLIVTRELLNDTGSCFVQISDENVHLVRNLMDEVFGSENFVSLITVKKTGAQTTNLISSVSDYIIWYGKHVEQIKYRQLFKEMKPGRGRTTGARYDRALLPDGEIVSARSRKSFPEGTRFFRYVTLSSNRPAKEHEKIPFEFEEEKYYPPANRTWTTNEEGFERLKKAGRIYAGRKSLNYIKFVDDFPANPIGNLWNDLAGATGKVYVVQTNEKVIRRCMLMCTDPGDLVLDPTCGSGTTAYVAEQWGRRWITMDSSRIALNIAKTRLMTAVYPYYDLHDEAGQDIRQGFVYKKVPHIRLGAIARDEPFEEETLFDKPKIDRKRLRVAGPFTVETLQAFEPVSPSELDAVPEADDAARFEQRIFEHLKNAGVKNGIRDEMAVFTRVDRLADAYLHAEGFYPSDDGERKAYIHIGPRFGTVSRQAVNEAVKACRSKGDADWLILLGFGFESDVQNATHTTSVGTFEVTKVRMHDDLLQEGLLKKDKKAASFVTIGEPDIALHCDGDTATVEIRGLDIYDPIRDQVKARNVADISYWMLDDDYDGSNFVVRQVFFCGGPKDAFKKWEKGLDDLAKRHARKSAEQTLKIEIDEDAFDRLYGFRSHPIPVTDDQQRIAVRVVSQFGEESTKVLGMDQAS